MTNTLKNVVKTANFEPCESLLLENHTFLKVFMPKVNFYLMFLRCYLPKVIETLKTLNKSIHF